MAANGGIAGLIGSGIVLGALALGLATFDMTPAQVPAQPVVSRTVPVPPPSSVTSVPPTPAPVAPETEVDDGGVVAVPVPLPHGDDDDHKSRFCRRHVWCVA